MAAIHTVRNWVIAEFETGLNPFVMGGPFQLHLIFLNKHVFKFSDF